METLFKLANKLAYLKGRTHVDIYCSSMSTDPDTVQL